MLDPLIELVQNASPEIKLAISALIGIVGVVCVFKPAANTIASFSKAEWLKGLMWFAAAIVVVAISVGIITVVYGFGQKQGESIESELSYDTHNVENVKNISQF